MICIRFELPAMRSYVQDKLMSEVRARWAGARVNRARGEQGARKTLWVAPISCANSAVDARMRLLAARSSILHSGCGQRELQIFALLKV